VLLLCTYGSQGRGTHTVCGCSVAAACKGMHCHFWRHRRGLKVPGQQQGLSVTGGAVAKSVHTTLLLFCLHICTLSLSLCHTPQLPSLPVSTAKARSPPFTVHALVVEVNLIHSNICKDRGAPCCCNPAVICWPGHKATGRAADWQWLPSVATVVAAGGTASIQQYQASSSTGPAIGDLPLCHGRPAQTQW
jgi:hypothetical protein